MFTRILFATTQHCHNETGRCFWLGTGSASWDSARTACQSQGWDLAVMETEELYDFVSVRFRYNLPLHSRLLFCCFFLNFEYGLVQCVNNLATLKTNAIFANFKIFLASQTAYNVQIYLTVTVCFICKMNFILKYRFTVPSWIFTWQTKKRTHKDSVLRNDILTYYVLRYSYNLCFITVLHFSSTQLCLVPLSRYRFTLQFERCGLRWILRHN